MIVVLKSVTNNGSQTALRHIQQVNKWFRYTESIRADYGAEKIQVARWILGYCYIEGDPGLINFWIIW